MTLGIEVLAWDRYKNMAGLNRLMVSQPSPLDTGISNSNIYINNTYINNTYINKLENITYYRKQ
jgi:hypothetical protein